MRLRVRHGDVDGPVLVWVDTTLNIELPKDVVAVDVLDSSPVGQRLLLKAAAQEVFDPA